MDTRSASELRVSGALIIIGDVSDYKAFLGELNRLLDAHDLRLVFQTISADRLRVVREADYRQGGRP